eukprot:gnl/TRDRNA2_/TRDRNA2_209268_c0_seq1.p2 gnl/TRDRNA2_/TRDRNA2_209268_c0~~gnl/TRDRNA2_/TRDRNA2_209268_c0_seq1.p2  ORF type:complete len:127 (-),score=6.95 gnl/TRDRNA2_/TRDRNA2_209268_c0_seq1:69-449(-)
MVRGQFLKTRLCHFELSGCCRKGTSCPFAHGVQDMRVYPDLTKTSICQKWARGCCPLPAERCSYAHGAADRRVSKAFWSSSVCSNFVRGFCALGDHCHQAHVSGKGSENESAEDGWAQQSGGSAMR